ncbi:MAG: leucyl/phenylalanyl-tRNA--protein transferase [Desulfomicrobium sp.]|nr:leucyl/phenylalanyl-tRNA--protein transferase [Desulfomicrobium sp.]
MTVFNLPTRPLFPDPAHADEDGLLAVGGDLSPQRLLMAYAQGIFPWYCENSPILWWSPDPRLVLEPAKIHVPGRLERILRQGRFAFTLDTAFERVITGCAETPRPGAHGTWIVPEMLAAYCRLHELGFAHSIEVWSGTILAGGLYGVALGGAFFGESMFYREPDASKAGLVTLMRLLSQAGFVLFDCQQTTAHMLRFGGFEMPRSEFLARLGQALELSTPRGPWSLRDGALTTRAHEYM